MVRQGAPRQIDVPTHGRDQIPGCNPLGQPSGDLLGGGRTPRQVALGQIPGGIPRCPSPGRRRSPPEHLVNGWSTWTNWSNNSFVRVLGCGAGRRRSPAGTGCGAVVRQGALTLPVGVVVVRPPRRGIPLVLQAGVPARPVGSQRKGPSWLPRPQPERCTYGRQGTGLDAPQLLSRTIRSKEGNPPSQGQTPHSGCPLLQAEGEHGALQAPSVHGGQRRRRAAPALPSEGPAPQSGGRIASSYSRSLESPGDRRPHWGSPRWEEGQEGCSTHRTPK